MVVDTDFIKTEAVVTVLLVCILQYVEKLEKILRFVIKEKALTKEDLDNIWAAQVGNYVTIMIVLYL